MKPNPLAELADAASDESDDSDGSDGPDDSDGSDESSDSDTDTAESGQPPLDLGASSCGQDLSLVPACLSCIGDSCCDLAEACAADVGCACALACLAAGGSQGSCKNECGAKPSTYPDLEPLQSCMQSACADGC